MAVDWMLSTVPLGGSMREKLGAIAASGFRHVELFYEDLADCAETPRGVARMLDDLGVSVGTLLPLRDFEIAARMDPTHPAWVDAGRLLDAASELNAQLVVACSSTRPDAARDAEAVANDMAALADRAMNQGLRIGYEALPWATHLKEAWQAARVVRLANRPNLGLVLDNFHIAWMGGGPETVRQFHSQEIALVQLSDSHMDRALDVRTLSRNCRCFPGQGGLPVRDFYDAVRDLGYEGPFSLEVFNSGFKSRPAGEVCRMAMNSIAQSFLAQGDDAGAPISGEDR